MDLREYYRKVREVESTLVGHSMVVVSLPTSDGGKAGVLTETPRHVAAKQITEGRARLADSAEADGFHAENLRVKRERDDAEAMSKVQFVVMPQKHSHKSTKE